MTIDARILLQPTTPNVTNQLMGIAQNINTGRQQKIENEKQNRLMQMKESEFAQASKINQLKIDEAEKARVMQSMLDGALEVNSNLDSGNVGGAYLALKRRKEALISQGRNTDDTDTAIALIEQGESGVQQLRKFTDSIIQQGVQRGLIQPDRAALTYDQALRGEELKIKKERLEYDKSQAKEKLEGLRSAVDSMDIPEDEKAALKNLQSSTLEKIITKQNDPKTRADKAEKEDLKKQALRSAQEKIELLDTMINHPGRESATGFSSIIPSRPGGDSKNYDLLVERAKGAEFLEVIQQLRGMGQLSNAEGMQATRAATSLSVEQSEPEHLKELQRLKAIIQRAMNIKPGTYDNDGQAESRFKIEVIE